MQISVRDFGNEEQKAFERISQLKLPVLQTLRIDSVLLRRVYDCAALYTAIFKFVAQHATVIKYLTLRISFRPYSPHKQPPKLVCSLEPNEIQNVREDLEMLRLEELTIFLDDYEGQENFDLGYQVMVQQASLYRLEVQVGRGDSKITYQHVAQVLRQNRRTLRHFTLSKVPMNSAVDEIETVLAALGELEKLESLRLFSFIFPSFPCSSLPHLRYLDLTGKISPQVLLQISHKCPSLEELQFSNLKSDFGILQNEWRDCVSIFLCKLRQLHVVRWFCPHISLNFLKNNPSLVVKTSPTNAFAAIIFIVNDTNA